LHGISLRNLSLPTSGASVRRRSVTVDDEVLPQSLQSPSKLLAQSDRPLEHSLSSTDLRPIQESTPNHGASKTLATGVTTKTPTRPGSKKLRRRSTVEWANASPFARQKRLEDVTNARIVDSFVSLHVPAEQSPFYVSEMIPRSMNPSFTTLDPSLLGPSIMRCDSVIVKVWARHESQDFQLLLELDINLRYLQYIGKTIYGFHHPLPQNCVLFRMTDGIYTILTTAHSDRPPEFQVSHHAQGNQKPLPTSSYDALMRLSTLDVCIHDALATRHGLEEQINKLLEENKAGIGAVEGVNAAEDAVEDAVHALKREKKLLDATRRRRDQLKASLHQRQKLMDEDRAAQRRLQEAMNAAHSDLQTSGEALKQNVDDIHGQRRRVCEDLQKIFPVEPVEGRSLAFTICGLQLPNSEFDDADELESAAALGHVAQVVHQLSFYLSTPLPYPLHCRGSTSSVDDPISSTTGATSYPLFSKGTARFRFEYGVFLLNKDIEILANRVGLKLMDIRQTLPNLKYLLYVSSAGKGELPARKAGGLRAFLRGGALAGSRKGSMDSTSSSIDSALRRFSTLAINPEGKSSLSGTAIRGSMAGDARLGPSAGRSSDNSGVNKAGPVPAATITSSTNTNVGLNGKPVRRAGLE
jgi:hypothetical protein